MRVHTVEKARKDYPGYGIKKGEKYYWWKFRMGGKVMSKTYPKRSQLTQSSYFSTLYDIQDRLASPECDETPEGLESFRDDIVSELESLRDEQEEKKDNMPESLQESPVAELLQERYDALDNAISELEGIDFSFDEDEKSEEEWRDEAMDDLGLDENDLGETKLREDAIEEMQLDEDDEESLQDMEKEINDAMQRIKEQREAEIESRISELEEEWQEKLSDWIEEKKGEMQDVSFE